MVHRNDLLVNCLNSRDGRTQILNFTVALKSLEFFFNINIFTKIKIACFTIICFFKFVWRRIFALNRRKLKFNYLLTLELQTHNIFNFHLLKLIHQFYNLYLLRRIFYHEAVIFCNFRFLNYDYLFHYLSLHPKIVIISQRYHI